MFITLKSFFTILLLCSVSLTNAQNYFTSIFTGASSYQGDLQDKVLSLAQSKPAWGVGFNYELNDRMLINLEFLNAKISFGFISKTILI